jgi:hypothetical protein
MLALVDGTRIPGGVIAFGDEGRDGASDRDRRGAARTRTPVAGCSPTIAGLAPPRPDWPIWDVTAVIRQDGQRAQIDGSGADGKPTLHRPRPLE